LRIYFNNAMKTDVFFFCHSTSTLGLSNN
jgi:hypothetical protein